MLVDTNIIIDHLRGKEEATSFLRSSTTGLYTSAICVTEVFAGIREGKERQILELTLSAFEIIPLDESLAEQAGLLKRQYQKSHSVGLGDAVVAATAQKYNLRLATLNKKHYPMLDNIAVPY